MRFLSFFISTFSDEEPIIFAHTFGGELHLDICDSYPDRTLVDEFIAVSARYGVTFRKDNAFFYQEAHYELPEH